MFLSEIVEKKGAEVAAAKARVPLAEMEARARAAAPVRRFLRKRAAGAPTQIIAEIKRRSPSKGLIREDFDPAAIARIYEAAGASAISILTDGPYFGGS
ncbi:MAG: indole-3-glycerol-phosphate synthase TrpC, partial [Myxococcales bacterium]|nr:indole-3-glycerol-phosphate synthase TrpC [Myxococcales bacterium]